MPDQGYRAREYHRIRKGEGRHDREGREHHSAQEDRLVNGWIAESREATRLAKAYSESKILGLKMISP